MDQKGNPDENPTTTPPMATSTTPSEVTVTLPNVGTVNVGPAGAEVLTDYRAKYEALREQVATAADAIERDHGSRWGEEQYNAGARAAAAVVRAILA